MKFIQAIIVVALAAVASASDVQGGQDEYEYLRGPASTAKTAEVHLLIVLHAL